MTLLEIVVLLAIAGVAGAIGQSLAGFTRGGCIGSIVVGFIGALLGLWIARALALPELFTVRVGEADFPIIWAIIGSTIFVAVLGMLTGRRRR